MSAWGLIRLGASVQENALATLTDLLGSDNFVNDVDGKPIDPSHKPARADIQKYKQVYDLWQPGQMGEDEKDLAKREWDDKYGLNETEQSIVYAYQESYQRLDHDSQKAFDQTIRVLRADNSLGLHGLDEQELKRTVGAALKKYEQQNYPMLYSAIRRALDDAYRRGPAESYKLWPRMVQWIKDRFEFFLWVDNNTFNPRSQSWEKLSVVSHYVDIATEGGAILSQLRAENKIPQNFDVNKLSAGEFESWLMDWKRENMESESQGQVVYEFKNGYTIQKLTTPESLQFEGDEMSHCVGGYHNQVADGSTIIYSLRDEKGEPHVTMEVVAIQGEFDGENPESEWIHPDRGLPHEDEHLKEGGSDKTFDIVQIQGKGNNTPKPEYQAMIKEFLDAMRAQGWKFKRSESWYGNWDDANRNYELEEEYSEDIDDARSLDGWWDDHYLPQNGLYRQQPGREDAYGMKIPVERIRPGVSDYEALLDSIVYSLLDVYDRGQFVGDWATQAQQVYHAWVADITHDDPSREILDAETKYFETVISNSEERLSENEWDNQGYALEDSNVVEDIAEYIQNQLEKSGEWEKFEEQLNEELNEEYGTRQEDEHGDLAGWGPEQIVELAQQESIDEYFEALEECVNKYYSGKAHKFLQYLYLLVNKHGLVGPNDLPDPNQRNGGLPSYDELEKMPWPGDPKAEQTTDIPGTFSSTHWAEVATPVMPNPNYVLDYNPEDRKDAGWQAYVRWISDDPYWEDHLQRINEAIQRMDWTGQFPKGTYSPAGLTWQQAQTYLLDRCGGDGPCAQIANAEPNKEFNVRTESIEWVIEKVDPSHFSKTKIPADEIQIHPIDQEHNTWLDEDGNEVRRYRPGWVKNPETGKMEQTGELEDSFLDNKGRQGQGYVAYHGDRPVGSLTYVEDPSGWLMLGTAYTHPDYRQQGIFNKLTQPLRETGKPIDAYVWNTKWLRDKVRSWSENQR